MLFSKSWGTAFSYLCQKGGEPIERGRATQREVCMRKGGVVCAQEEKVFIYTHTYLWTYCLTLASLVHQLFTYSSILSL